MMLSKFAGMKKFILGENMQTAADVVGLLKLDYILNSCMEKQHGMKGDRLPGPSWEIINAVELSRYVCLHLE